jgi:type II secretory ATPase GspE/PulE/Tfp pilus assembly ATPase PilB-like protein
MRKRAAGLLQHKFETACTMMSRGSATYMRSIIAQRLLRRYFTTFKQIWREKVLREEQRLLEEEDEMDQRYTHSPKCRKSAPSDLI